MSEQLYRVTFNDGRKDLLANYVQLDSTGGKLHIIQGTCTCYKSFCNCHREYYLPMHIVESYEAGTYAGPGVHRPKKKKKKPEMNLKKQIYKGITLQLICRYDYGSKNAKRFTLNGTNQNVWIPNKHLTADGTIKEYEDIDYVFRKAPRQLELAGYTEPIPGIKRRSLVAN